MKKAFLCAEGGVCDDSGFEVTCDALILFAHGCPRNAIFGLAVFIGSLERKRYTSAAEVASSLWNALVSMDSELHMK